MKIQKMTGYILAAMMFTGGAQAGAHRDADAVGGTTHAVSRVESDKRIGTLRVPVSVDLSRVTILGQPAALGAYVARITFDPTRVEFVAAAPGTAKGFSTPPYVTNTRQANRDGLVKLTAVNTDDVNARGQVSVASVQFRERESGGRDSIKVSLESVASMLLTEKSGQATVYNIEVKDAE